LHPDRAGRRIIDEQIVSNRASDPLPDERHLNTVVRRNSGLLDHGRLIQGGCDLGEAPMTSTNALSMTDLSARKLLMQIFLPVLAALAFFAGNVATSTGSFAKSAAYERGFADGKMKGQKDGYQDAYKDAYEASYNDALISGFARSKSTASQDYAVGFKRGYKVGYKLGWKSGQRDGDEDGYSDGKSWKQAMRDKMRRCMREGTC